MKKYFLITSLFILFITTAGANLPEGLRDVKAPVSFPSNYLLLVTILIILLIGCILALIRFLKAKQAKVEELPIDTRLAWEIAFEELEQLEKSSLLDEGQFKVYYSRLSDIVRKYFENQFTIKAPEMTTEEFLWSLKELHEFTAAQKDALKNFLNSCDIVKFAKYIPGIEEGKESFQLAWRLVEETKIVLNGENANVN